MSHIKQQNPEEMNKVLSYLCDGIKEGKSWDSCIAELREKAALKSKSEYLSDEEIDTIAKIL